MAFWYVLPGYCKSQKFISDQTWYMAHMPRPSYIDSDLDHANSVNTEFTLIYRHHHHATHQRMPSLISDDHAVSIVNITTPSAPTTASVVSDGTKYKNLNNPYSITTTTIGSSTYALVAAKGDNGVQVIDITNPYAPDDASHPTNGSNGFTKLGDPVSITTIAGSPEYALVTANLMITAFKSCG